MPHYGQKNLKKPSLNRVKQQTVWLNPIQTGGGQFDPPLYKIRDCRATAANRNPALYDFFLSSVSQILTPSSKKSDTPLSRYATLRNRMSGLNWTKIVILHAFVYKILLFSKFLYNTDNCAFWAFWLIKFVFILIKIHFSSIKNYKNKEIHKK